MVIKESKIFSYEEKISIIKEVKEKGNRTKIARKYGIGESTIRGWEIYLQTSQLKKTKQIIINDLFDCKIKTDLMEICEMLQDEVSDKCKAKVIIPFMVKKGYKEDDLIKFFNMSKYRFNELTKNI